MANLLSYGPDSRPLPLKPLNVVIGPNGSGKSNLIEAFALLQSAPAALAIPVREGGGIHDWLYKGAEPKPVAEVEAVVDNPEGKMPLRYRFAFTESASRFELVDERIENERPCTGKDEPYFYYRYQNGHPVLNVAAGPRTLKREDVSPEQSILSQRKDPDQYPDITYLGQVLGTIRIYREWSFGRNTMPRLPQKTDLPNDFLDPMGANLALVLNRLRKAPAARKRIVEQLNQLYDGIEDFDTGIEGGSAQVFLHESRGLIPATRLSDGTLRYLCLLAVLCHPTPPPLVCIEEPELGLHPDVLPGLAKLLLETSERCQLVVTTHSDILVDALTQTPDMVVVCERDGAGTMLKRLSAEELKPWLEKYRLGELWTRGEIGGTRW